MRQHTIETPYVVGEVHCYSTEIDGELVLFDCGPPTPEAFASLKAQIDLSRLKYLFITHCHIDHFGLIPYIQKETDARVFIPRVEDRKVRLRPEYLKLLAELMTQTGCEHRTIDYMCNKIDSELQLLRPGSYEVVEESDLPHRLGIGWISCPGHSQSDLVYLHGGHAITGDILLRNIFQVPIYDVDLTSLSGRFRNYDAYCGSLAMLSRLQGLQIHPGHRWHIDSMEETVLWYVRKVLKRAELLHDSCATERIGAVMESLYGHLTWDPFLVHMKLSEACFARDFLANPAPLKTALESLGLFDKIRAQYSSVVS